jgi:hypothetical protein
MSTYDILLSIFNQIWCKAGMHPLLYEIPNNLFIKRHIITLFATYISLALSSYLLSNFTLMTIISTVLNPIYHHYNL